eukprot:1390406-Rhodomonas_salina.1
MEDHELEVERVTDHLAWSRARVSEGEAASMCKGVQVKLSICVCLGTEGGKKERRGRAEQSATVGGGEEAWCEGRDADDGGARRFVGQAAGTLGLDGHICELQLVPAALALQLSEQELLRFRNLRDAYTAQARSAQPTPCWGRCTWGKGRGAVGGLGLVRQGSQNEFGRTRTEGSTRMLLGRTPTDRTALGHAQAGAHGLAGTRGESERGLGGLGARRRASCPVVLLGPVSEPPPLGSVHTLLQQPPLQDPSLPRARARPPALVALLPPAALDEAALTVSPGPAALQPERVPVPPDPPSGAGAAMTEEAAEGMAGGVEGGEEGRE